MLQNQQYPVIATNMGGEKEEVLRDALQPAISSDCHGHGWEKEEVLREGVVSGRSPFLHARRPTGCPGTS